MRTILLQSHVLIQTNFDYYFAIGGLLMPERSFRLSLQLQLLSILWYFGSDFSKFSYHLLLVYMRQKVIVFAQESSPARYFSILSQLSVGFFSVVNLVKSLYQHLEPQDLIQSKRQATILPLFLAESLVRHLASFCTDSTEQGLIPYLLQRLQVAEPWAARYSGRIIIKRTMYVVALIC